MSEFITAHVPDNVAFPVDHQRVGPLDDRWVEAILPEPIGGRQARDASSRNQYIHRCLRNRMRRILPARRGIQKRQIPASEACSRRRLTATTRTTVAEAALD